jgi:hypothetical protein
VSDRSKYSSALPWFRIVPSDKANRIEVSLSSRFGIYDRPPHPQNSLMELFESALKQQADAARPPTPRLSTQAGPPRE